MPEVYYKFLAAIAPAVVLAMIMIQKDRRPEPNRWLWAAVGLGVLICPVLYLLAKLRLSKLKLQTDEKTYTDTCTPFDCLHGNRTIGPKRIQAISRSQRAG